MRHDISWFDKESSAVGILTSRLESEASLVSEPYCTAPFRVLYVFVPLYTSYVGKLLKTKVPWCEVCV